MLRSFTLILIAAVLTGSTFLMADKTQSSDVPTVGDSAPKFEGKDQTGKLHTSADLFGQGKYVVVYFYPADMTGGCTKQACGFRDDLGELAGKDVAVIGVSGDTVENHRLFAKAHDLNFTLLADPEGEIAKAFGVPFKKGEQSIKRTIDGEDYTLTRGGTAKRYTFLIGKDGKILMRNEKVKAAEDSAAILKAIKSE